MFILIFYYKAQTPSFSFLYDSSYYVQKQKSKSDTRISGDLYTGSRSLA